MLPTTLWLLVLTVLFSSNCVIIRATYLSKVEAHTDINWITLQEGINSIFFVCYSTVTNEIIQRLLTIVTIESTIFCLLNINRKTLYYLWEASTKPTSAGSDDLISNFQNSYCHSMMCLSAKHFTLKLP